ncbi:hypothetical protein RJ639_012174 [Escallonia herrerae]|uniref:Pentatricopeptide repeat-containing protein n=1 Tax=Escallonia herrerae TaxID=1293975 RepID=A0AA88VQL9_9ASTE|nr:hypothetical protein RJ639_012174 [Escallonia herrerae]
MILTGYIKDTFAASRLLKFSTDSNFIHVDYSYKIFNHLERSNGFIWNAMMRAYSQRNHPQKAILLYKLMVEKNVCPDKYTYPVVVQAVSTRVDALEGKEIHSHVLKMGFDSDVYVGNTLINMYAVCGDISDARKVFDEMPVLDLVSWNSILAGYVQMGDVEKAKLMFDQMPRKNVIASNSMIVLFGRSGRVSEARQLFDEMDERDLVSWTALISCYDQNEIYEEALATFTEMYARGITVDEVLIISVLSACANLLVVKTGALIHGLALRIGIDSYRCISGSRDAPKSDIPKNVATDLWTEVLKGF